MCQGLDRWRVCCNKVKLSSCKRSMIHAKFMRISLPSLSPPSPPHLPPSSPPRPPPLLLPSSSSPPPPFLLLPLPPHLPPSLPPSLHDSCMIHGAAAPPTRFDFVTGQPCKAENTLFYSDHLQVPRQERRVPVDTTVQVSWFMDRRMSGQLCSHARKEANKFDPFCKQR